MGQINIGESQDYGNPGDSIPVKLSDGSFTSAIAATPINASKVLVATTNEGIPYVFANLSGSAIGDQEITRVNLVKRKPAIALEYPFKVLVKGDLISVQGFDDDTDVTISGELIGLVNTGDSYTAIVRDGNSYLFDIDGTQTTVSLIGSDFGLSDVPPIYWYGANNLLSSIYSFYPNTTYSETPQITPSGAIQSMTLPNYGRSQIWNVLYGTRTTTGTDYLVEDTGLGYVNWSYIQNGNTFSVTPGYNGYPVIQAGRQTLFDLSGVPVSWDDHGKVFNCTTDNSVLKSSTTELTKTKSITTYDKRFLVTETEVTEYPITNVTSATGSYNRDTSFSSSAISSWSGHQTTGDNMFLCLVSLSSSGIGTGTETGSYEESVVLTGVQPLITDINKKNYYLSATKEETINVTQSSDVSISDITNAVYISNEFSVNGIQAWSTNKTLNLNLTTNHVFRRIERSATSILISGRDDILIYFYTDTDKTETTSNVKNKIRSEIYPTVTSGDPVPIYIEWDRYDGIFGYTWVIYGIDPIFTENDSSLDTVYDDYVHSYFDIPDLEEVYTITDNKTTPPISCVMQIGETSYEIEDTYGNYESGFVFLAENLELQIGSNTLNITTSYIGINSTNGAFKQNIVKEQITTYLVDSSGNSTSNTTYDYHSQPFYIPSGDIEVYSVDNGTVQKWDGVISSFTRSVSGDNQTFQTITFTLVSQSTVDFYSWFNIHNGVVIVPKNNHTISILKYIESDRNRVNIYNFEDTIRVAVSKEILPDNLNGEEEWFADIYEFDTVEKKFICIGNESGSLTEITGTEYDFVSYYPV